MDALANLVPEAYYDLIARVPPGVIFLGVLASDPAFMQPPLTPRDLNGSLLVSLLLLGYAVGVVLSSIGGARLSTRLWTRQWKTAVDAEPRLREHFKTFPAEKFEDSLALMYENLCKEPNRALLIKLNAEVTLCANLVVAFLLLLVLHLLQWRTTGVEEMRVALLSGAAGLALLALFRRQRSTTDRQKTMVLGRLI